MSISFLVLEDGSVFEGEAFGHICCTAGEVVFSTGMSGYQESLTDPSVRGQMLVMTYPLIGNYGAKDDYCRSECIHARALIVREYCKEPSPMYGGRTLDDVLKCSSVPGISGIDTRELTIKIRTMGTLKGAVVDREEKIDDTIKGLGSTPLPSEQNLAGEVSVRRIEGHNFGKDTCIGILDCGGRDRLIKDLAERFNVVVFPYDTAADVISDHKVKGLIVSDGPGNPSHPSILKTTARTVADLSTWMPVFGVGLGSQIVGAAMGGKTYKMKFGHHGSNQPVRCEGRVFITSQNHGFAMEAGSLEEKDMIADQINVNDGTVEGFRHKDLPIFTSQYHPKVSPGQGDTSFLFDRFAKAVKEGR
ncbi:MAG: glutamine-hydrolyzing carbamoyl-phosphate synthase small subunit [Candidatus Methanoplasma sp.]|jgi:carbamoyl-phosphate synthase small subunit|nr:glutamine-hydrolyzing carbamoyl-phosphate synthase small subunit [Candidatus Methanoplasma sp.]